MVPLPTTAADGFRFTAAASRSADHARAPAGCCSTAPAIPPARPIRPTMLRGIGEVLRRHPQRDGDERRYLCAAAAIPPAPHATLADRLPRSGRPHPDRLGRIEKPRDDRFPHRRCGRAGLADQGDGQSCNRTARAIPARSARPPPSPLSKGRRSSCATGASASARGATWWWRRSTPFPACPPRCPTAHSIAWSMPRR